MAGLQTGHRETPLREGRKEMEKQTQVGILKTVPVDQASPVYQALFSRGWKAELYINLVVLPGSLIYLFVCTFYFIYGTNWNMLMANILYHV